MHHRRINQEGQCRLPKPKVITVPADPVKSYTPHCTILHRCGGDTGCCHYDNQLCVMKHQHSVDLFFIVTTLGSDQETYEKRTFENHTECHCVDREEGMQSSQTDLAPNPLLSCDCPAEYRGKVDVNGECKCDCDASNLICRDLKKGLQAFTIPDRRWEEMPLSWWFQLERFAFSLPGVSTRASARDHCANMDRITHTRDGVQGSRIRLRQRQGIKREKILRCIKELFQRVHIEKLNQN